MRKIWFKVAPQIMKELINSLYNCKARFEVVTYRNEIVIYDIEGFSLSENNQFGILINTENNTKLINIQRDNVEEFTIHN